MNSLSEKITILKDEFVDIQIQNIIFTKLLTKQNFKVFENNPVFKSILLSLHSNLIISIIRISKGYDNADYSLIDVLESINDCIELNPDCFSKQEWVKFFKDKHGLLKDKHGEFYDICIGNNPRKRILKYKKWFEENKNYIEIKKTRNKRIAHLSKQFKNYLKNNTAEITESIKNLEKMIRFIEALVLHNYSIEKPVSTLPSNTYEMIEKGFRDLEMKHLITPVDSPLSHR